MYQHGGRAWQDWNSTVREVLISEQVTSERTRAVGNLKINGDATRRLYSTALATLTLEVLLPLSASLSHE